MINEDRKEEGAPKALVFQGSYMNGMGYKFLENSFGEYISVHDYRNITYLTIIIIFFSRTVLFLNWLNIRWSQFILLNTIWNI